MALSDYERQMLEELEAQLADEDPSFVKTMKPEAMPPVLDKSVSLPHIVVGLLVAVAGIALLVVAIAVPFIPVGVIGVVVMGVGFWYATSPTDSVPQSASGASREKSSSARRMSFMDRQAERWEKRQGA